MGRASLHFPWTGRPSEALGEVRVGEERDLEWKKGRPPPSRVAQFWDLQYNQKSGVG